ncbi:hypothetical protein [Actinacidiphila glaucinigra]|uniref:hypothetical protein n=1 Tax=Actinacidiphila glaucinigra TaxID=235986 RepID=UPI00366C0737
MEANARPRVDVTYSRFKHGRGFTWMAVVVFDDGGGARYPTSGSLAAVSRWVTEVLEVRYTSQEIACVSGFKFAGGRAGADAGTTAQRSIADLATARDETAEEAAASALQALGVAQLDVDFALQAAGQRVGVAADLNRHGGAGAIGRPWLGSLTGQMMEKWRTSESS